MYLTIASANLGDPLEHLVAVKCGRSFSTTKQLSGKGASQISSVLGPVLQPRPDLEA